MKVVVYRLGPYQERMLDLITLFNSHWLSAKFLINAEVLLILFKNGLPSL